MKRKPRKFQVPFRFNGKIINLTFKLGPPQLTAADVRVVGAAIAKSRD